MRFETLAGIALIAVVGCHRGHRVSVATPAVITADTLRGTFVLEGADPMPVAVLRTLSGRVELDNVPAAMRGLVKLEVWVSGVVEGNNRFRVASFLVRGAGGDPAWDGTVEQMAGGFVVRLPDGTAHALRGTSAEFARLVGARVWVTETAAHTVASYGVIE